MKSLVDKKLTFLFLSIALLVALPIHAMEEDKPEYSSFIDNLIIVKKRKNQQLGNKLFHQFNQEIQQKKVIEQVDIIADLIPYAAQKDKKITSMLCNVLIGIVKNNDSSISVIRERISPIIHLLAANQQSTVLEKFACIFADNTESEEYKIINEAIQSNFQKSVPTFESKEDLPKKDVLWAMATTVEIIQTSIPKNPQRTVIFCNRLLMDFIINYNRESRTNMRKIISPIINPLIAANNIEALEKIKDIFLDYDHETEEHLTITRAIKQNKSMANPNKDSAFQENLDKAISDNACPLSIGQSPCISEGIVIDFMELQKESAQLKGHPLQDNEIDEFLIKIFHEQINNRPSFRNTPNSLGEAIIRLKSIFKLFEKSRIYIASMEITEDSCIVQDSVLPHHTTNSRFKKYFDLLKNQNLLLSNEKSIEAIDVIIESLKTLHPNNVDKCIQTINSLPTIFSQHIKNTFISMAYERAFHHLQPYELNYDDKGRVTSLKFKKDGYNIQITNIEWVGQHAFGRLDIGIYSSGETCTSFDLSKLHEYLNKKNFHNFLGTRTIFSQENFIWQLDFEASLKYFYNNKHDKQKEQSSLCGIS